MPHTLVDTWTFNGALDAESVAERIGADRAVCASRLVFESLRAAAHRSYQKSDGLGVFFTWFYAPVDRLCGLSPVLWRNRDMQYVEDIKAIRHAIAALIGEDEETAFPAPKASLLRDFGIPSDAPLFSFDNSLRKGDFPEDVRSLSDALDEQISEFLASRFNRRVGAVDVATFVLRSIVS